MLELLLILAGLVFVAYAVWALIMLCVYWNMP